MEVQRHVRFSFKLEMIVFVLSVIDFHKSQTSPPNRGFAVVCFARFSFQGKTLCVINHCLPIVRPRHPTATKPYANLWDWDVVGQ